MERSIVFLFLIVGLIGYGCDKAPLVERERAQQAAIANTIFSDRTTEFKVNVFYEAGASPYVGSLGISANQTWDITKASYQALFQNHSGRTLTVPTTLAQMSQVTAQGKSTWVASELIALGRQLAPELANGTQANVSIIFVSGTYQGDTSVLGIQFTGSPFAFVFKDVVVSVGGDSVSQRYVEQATVIHELGHVVGLVNNGLPMVSVHEDSSHAHHTVNTNCVMYWAVESKSNVLSSIGGLILGNQLNLFGSESLQDGRAYHPN